MTTTSPHMTTPAGRLFGRRSRRSGDTPAERTPAERTPETGRQAVKRILRCDLRVGALLSAVMFTVSMALPAYAAAAKGETDTSSLLQLAIYLGALSLLPFAVMTMTSFLRIVVVLSFLRSGLGAQNVPPNMVIIALSLFLSLFVMGPTLDAINENTVQPILKGVPANEVLPEAADALKNFMLLQIGGKNGREEIKTFYRLAHKQATNAKTGGGVCPGSMTGKPEGCLANETQYEKYGAEVLPLRVVIPAFMISELKKAFIMGFAVLLPFLVIDMVISNILLSLGMFMLPPVVISLPFKILLFVIAGGWTMVVEFLVAGFNY